MIKKYDINHGCQECFLIECDCEISKYDCPCSSLGCCDNPHIITPNHICNEDICEDCFVNKCLNCGTSCACDL
jgi:hypothetical protein